MKNNIEILFDVTIDDFENEFFEIIEDVIKKTLDFEKIYGNFEVSVSIVSNEEIQEINFEHRGFNKPTDVLSFPLIRNFEKVDNNFVNSLGDIIISYEKAKEQSEEYNHTLKREIAFLTAHSMLHLLGYDHMVLEEEKVMFDKQKEILNELNYTR